MEDLLIQMYQYLVRYGTIEIDKENKFEGHGDIFHHRTTIYDADGDLWLVTIFNGQIMGIKRYR